jgi:hypothetical protein
MKYYILGMLLFLCSCVSHDKYENAKSFSFEDFPVQKELVGNVLEFDSLIMRPRDIFVSDSVLVVIEMGMDKLFHLYNLNSRKYMASHIIRGNGPDDMLSPRFVKGKNNVIGVCDMNTSKVYEYGLTDFVNSMKPVPLYDAKLEATPFVGVIDIDNKYVSSTYGENGKQFCVFDKTGKRINQIVDYPSSSISYTDAEKRDAYYANIVGNGKDRIAVCYSMTDLIEIYRVDGELLNRIHGPEQFFARFNEARDGDVITSAPEKNVNRDAYFSPCSDGERLFVLYDGDYVDSPDNDRSCSYLMVFSWDGKPEAQYRLNDPIIAFTIDGVHKKIYGIGMIPEFHIVEYSF